MYKKSVKPSEITFSRQTVLEGILILPSATKLQRLCFYTCISVHKGGVPAQVPPRTRYLPCTRYPLGPGTPPSRRLLLRTVRILLEGIIVIVIIITMLKYKEKGSNTDLLRGFIKLSDIVCSIQILVNDF